MAAPGWIRKWKAAPSSEGRASGILRAATRGDSPDRLPEGIRSQVCLSRAMLRGVSLESILPQIARAARQHLQAVFVAIGKADGSPTNPDGWDSPEEYRALLLREPLLNTWHAVLSQGHPIHIGRDLRGPDAFPWRPSSEPNSEPISEFDGVFPSLAWVMALPIEVRNRTGGVLIAGLSSETRDSSDFTEDLLESYGLLAGSALDRELAREEREADALRKAEMQGLLDSIDSGVLLLDAAGNIRVASERLAQILGLEARSIRELGSIDALMDALTNRFANPAETIIRWRERLSQAEPGSWDELELLRPSRKIVERFARPLFHRDGTRLGWLEVYRDITGQRLIQSKMLQTEKMAALGQLVSGIAHELNNPLTSIQGYAQLLLSRPSAAERTDDARQISQEAARAGRIVKNLLLFSRETKPERRPVNLNEVIERTFALRAYELKIENIAVDLVLDQSLPHILADAAQLQQVVLNLIVNAEQAVQQGREQGSSRGRLRILTRRLAGDRIAMKISDDGAGIPPENVSRIFDPFFTTKPVGVGTGLGLSIVYGIVQEHGGEVAVESQLGHGACFTVEFPALSTAALDASAGKPAGVPHPVTVIPAPRAGSAEIHRERVLVVEDEPTVAQLIADVESAEGYQVDTLLDSREALRQLEQKHYDLIICDLKMPHLDGAGLYRALVRAGNPLHRKLLFVTGDTMSPRSLDFLNASGSPYLAKPFLVEELKESVRQALATGSATGSVAEETTAARGTVATGK